MNAKIEQIQSIFVISVGLILSLLIAIVFLKIGNSALEYDTLFKLDNTILDFVIKNRTSSLNIFFKGITFLGSIYAIVGMSILIMGLLVKYRKYFELVFFSSVLTCSIALNTLLKVLFHKPRPQVEALVTEYSYSFPSGHAMTSIVFYSLLAFLIFRLIKSEYWRFIVISFLGFLLVLIGFSRIYLGVHFPSDVLAGYLAGIWVILISYLIFYMLRYITILIK